MNLYVGNVAEAVTEEELKTNFEQAGSVISVVIATDLYTGLGRGFGYVEMGTDEETREAIKRFDKTEFHGQTISVGLAPQDGGSGEISGLSQGGTRRQARSSRSGRAHRFYTH